MSKYIRRASTFVVGDYTVLLRKFQRFTNSPNNDTRATFTSEIISATWVWNRIGGCGVATIELATNPTFSPHINPFFNINHNIYQELSLPPLMKICLGVL